MSAIKNFFRSPKKVIGFAIKLAFIVGVFSVLFFPEKFGISPEKFKGLSFDSLRDVVSQIDWGQAAFWIAFAVVVKLAGILCGVVRWHLLLRGQGIKLPFWYLTKCWFMGRAIGLFLPGTVGLDGYRLVETSAYTGEVIKCTTVVAIEKLIGFVALAILVFLTLPLGARLFTFNPLMLAGILAVLAVFIATAFLLLLNPRIVQVLVAVLPTPPRIRHQVNKLGVAVTAYSGHRAMLVLAVILGLGIHLGICLMYFGTAMAISKGQSDVLDVLFASPLIIVGSIIAPTVSGVGVREGVMTVLLGGKYGESAAFLFGHIGLWVGEAVPFLLSLPLLLFAGRPDREGFMAELEKVRKESAVTEEDLHLPPDIVTAYRSKLVTAFTAGILGGLIGGAAFGLGEAIVHMHGLGHFTDANAYWWGPLVYGIVFSAVGLGVSAVLVFAYLLFNRFAPGKATFALSLAGTVGLLGLVIGTFRYKRDVLHEAAMGAPDYLRVFIGTIVVAVVAAGIAYALARFIRGGRVQHVTTGLAAFVLIVLVGGGIAALREPVEAAPAFEAKDTHGAPNIILIAVDTVRADFLPVFSMNAPAKTPNLVKFSQDAVVFQNAIAQSSWTKASFGTIFSGMYPEAHTATGKASALPLSVTTMAEVLHDGGYYTRGFSNNPNITSLFNYDQGFVQYTDLKPDLYFGAKASSEKLVLYDILRKVVQVFNAKVLGGRINITDFYQPAERVTNVGLNWIDGPNRPNDAPFFLFLHYMDPHDPYRDPDRPGKGYARVQMPNPDPEKYKDKLMRSYTYEIEYMDTHVGRLLDGLKERGLYDNALIVFTADHGEEFHEHGGWWHGLSLYDEQIRIPLMIKLPGERGKGTYISDLARHVDLAPTLAKFAGLPPDPQWQGKPLLTDALASNTGDVQYVHSHLDFEGIRLKSLRSMDRKLIVANEGNKRGYAPTELYNLAEDPGEQHNIAEDSPAEVGLFKDSLSQMDEFINQGAAEPTGFDTQNLPPAMREQLRSLGYLGGDSGAPESSE